MDLTYLQRRLLRSVLRGKFPITVHYSILTLESLFRRGLISREQGGRVRITELGKRGLALYGPEVVMEKDPEIIRANRIIARHRRQRTTVNNFLRSEKKRKRELAELERLLTYHPSTRSKKPLQDIIFPKKGPN